MSMIAAIVPNLPADDPASALRRCLEAVGYSVADADAPDLTSAGLSSVGTPETPDRVAWYVTSPSGASRPCMVLRTEPRWDPALARALSSWTGGFALTVESDRRIAHYGFALFYAGRTVEMYGEDQRHGLYRADVQRPFSSDWPEETFLTLAARVANSARSKRLSLSSA